MRNLEESGLGLLLEGADPEPLSAPAEAAVHCWNWCEGWRPERWPLYEALYPVPDWHQHIALMQALRAAINKQPRT